MSSPLPMPSRPLTSRKVEATYYLIAGVYTLSASLIWGVNTMFLLSAGLTLMQAFLAKAPKDLFGDALEFQRVGPAYVSE